MESLHTLIETLLHESDELAETSLQRLTGWGAKAFPTLQALLESEENDLRWWAVRGLAEIDHPEVPALLQAALHDPDFAVRQCAALALRIAPNPNAIPDLLAALQAGDRLLARLAADALAELGAESVPGLLGILAGGGPMARLESIRALAMLDDMRAVPALFACLDDESPLIEYWADLGLQRRGIGMTFFHTTT